MMKERLNPNAIKEYLKSKELTPRIINIKMPGRKDR